MPGVYCAVYGCLNKARSKPGLSYFKLPTQPDRCAQWLHLICRDDLIGKPPKNHHVCEAHFLRHFVMPGVKNKKLKSNAVPTLYLPDQTKLIFGAGSELRLPEDTVIIANVYRYLQNEYETLKGCSSHSCDLSPLANVLKRTAEATGVSEETVTAILERSESAQDHQQHKNKRAKRNKKLRDGDVSASEGSLSKETCDEHTADDECMELQQLDIDTLKLEIDEEDMNLIDTVKDIFQLKTDSVVPETISAAVPMMGRAAPTQAKVKTEVNIDDLENSRTVSADHSLHPQVELEPNDTNYEHDDPLLIVDTTHSHEDVRQ